MGKIGTVFTKGVMVFVVASIAYKISRIDHEISEIHKAVCEREQVRSFTLFTMAGNKLFEFLDKRDQKG